MLTKEELHSIRHGFQGLRLDKAEHGHLLEVGYYEIACYQLGRLCSDWVKSCDSNVAYLWLVKVVFVHPGKIVFITAREAYIHVMASLDILVEMAVPPKNEPD